MPQRRSIGGECIGVGMRLSLLLLLLSHQVELVLDLPRVGIRRCWGPESTCNGQSGSGPEPPFSTNVVHAQCQ